jgi:two-component system nitrogen regulation response regulator NtrX
VKFEEDAMQLLMRLPFTGNIRELRNVVERIVILVPGDSVKVDDVQRLGLAFSMSDRQSTQSQQSSPIPTQSQPTGELLGAQSVPMDTPVDSDDLAKSVILTPADLRRMESIEKENYSLLGNEVNPLDTAMQALTFQEFKDRAERAYIEERLKEHNWNISRTADALDIQRSHLYTKMRKYGLMKDAKGVEGLAETHGDAAHDVEMDEEPGI